MKRNHTWTGIAVVLLLLIALPVSAAERPAAWAEPLNIPETENFFRVTKDLYRSGQPPKEAMKAYEAFGIKTVINLRNHHTDDDEAKGTGLILVPLATSTTGVTEDAFMVKALQAIRDAQKPVLVHCMHGADRTGLVIAMFRMVEKGWSREDSIQEMREGRYGFHSVWAHIPKYLEKVDAEKIRKELR
jgi:protein tyrosine/serine phosphatase